MVDYNYCLGSLAHPGVIFTELTLSNVSYDRQLNYTGSFQGAFYMSDPKAPLAVQYFNPGQVAIYAYRDGECIWGGIGWSFQYSSSDQSFSITGQTWESYFDHVVLAEDFVSANIASELYGGSGIETNCSDIPLYFFLPSSPGFLQPSIGINIPTDYPFGVTGDEAFPTLNLQHSEYHFASEVMTALYANDIIMTIDPLTRTVRYDGYYPGVPGAGSIRNGTLPYREFWYPGTISDYSWSNSATPAGVQIVATGAGSSSFVITADDPVNASLPTDTVPWWKVVNNPDITNMPDLQSYAYNQARLFSPSNQNVPTFICNPEAAKFDLFNVLGANIAVNINDARTGYRNQRYVDTLVGWQLTPASSTSDEELQFVVGKTVALGAV